MSEGRHKWSEVSEEEANQYRRNPARRVATPGAGLIIVGCLGIVANVLLAMCLNALRQDRGPVERPPGMDDETFKAYERGRAAAPLLDCCLIALPTLAVYPLVIAAGIRMRQLQSRGLAIVGAILGMAPCSPVVLLGLPVGVWSLIVLADPAVRAAFAGGRRHR
jgi:hypothetical protein